MWWWLLHRILLRNLLNLLAPLNPTWTTGHCGEERKAKFSGCGRASEEPTGLIQEPSMHPRSAVQRECPSVTLGGCTPRHRGTSSSRVQARRVGPAPHSIWRHETGCTRLGLKENLQSTSRNLPESPGAPRASPVLPGGARWTFPAGDKHLLYLNARWRSQRANESKNNPGRAPLLSATWEITSLLLAWLPS